MEFFLASTVTNLHPAIFIEMNLALLTIYSIINVPIPPRKNLLSTANRAIFNEGKLEYFIFLSLKYFFKFPSKLILYKRTNSNNHGKTN